MRTDGRNSIQKIRRIAAAALVLAMAAIRPVYAETETNPTDAADTRVLSFTKDGLEAELETVPGETGFTALIHVVNQSPYVERIRVDIALPDDCVLVCTEGADTEIDVAEGTSHTFALTFGPEPVASVVPLMLAVAALVVAVGATALFCIRRGTKSAKHLCALFMAAGATILFMLPSAAADTVRSFTLSDTVTVNGEEIAFTATVSYHYHFEETEVHKTTGMKQFDITYYWGPHGDDILNEDYIRAIAECGFTAVPIENNTRENNQAALKLLAKYGLRCSALWDARINAAAFSETPMTQAEVNAVIESVSADYRDYDNLFGYYIMDEPSAERFPNLAKVITALRRYEPDREGMINLFPTYANAQQLGRDTYLAYVSDFVKEVNPHYISYDHYHFQQENKARSGFFTNLEYVRQVGLDTGLDQMQIILLTQHYNYADLTPTQITWEVNMSLAYGMKRISYFTFWLDKNLVDEGWTNGCMSYTGEIYPHYYDVQAINQWLLPLGTELFDKQSTAVFHLSPERNIEPQCVAYQPYGDLGEIAGEDAVIGFFDDGSFMIVNKNYKEGDRRIRSYTLLDHASGLTYFDTTDAAWKSLDDASFSSKDENGKYVITLDPGHAVLLRVAS